MTPNNPKSRRRQRGAVLSFEGWQRLQIAEQNAARQDNHSYPYTLEQLSLITGLSTNTLTKVRRREHPVDVSSLEIYFESFELTLKVQDYGSPENIKTLDVKEALTLNAPFRGPLPFNSPFYVYRPPLEQSCFQEILLPGALVRVKAPCQFGKTSLMTLLMEYGRSQGLQAVVVNLKLVDRRFLQSTNQFMQWFCALVARSLNLPNELDHRWDDQFGGSYSCTEYFETYLLAVGDRPLLLLLDGADELFAHTEIAIDFFSMLRAWYEQGSYDASREVWQRLRLVLTHSMDAGQTFSPHRSPFNVGVSILLSPFNVMQIQSLAFRYGLEPSEQYGAVLGQLLGGHPYLVQMSLFYLSHAELSLGELVEKAITYDSIFASHLRRQGEKLENDAELTNAIHQMLREPQGTKFPPRLAFRLQGLGWTIFEKQHSLISCELYRRYFTSLLEV